MPMCEGVIALIDVLGFGEIWKRIDHDLLLEKLRYIMLQIQPQIIAGIPFHLLRRKFIIKASLLSDSVAISLQYTDAGGPNEREKNYEKNFLVWLICASTVKILDLYLDGEPPLILRGNITYGKFAHEGNFIVGPAVDDAYRNMEVAQGGFVWLDPTTEEMYVHCVETTKQTIRILSGTRNDEELLHGSMQALAVPLVVDSYNMPLKGGEYLRCAVLNPLAFHKTEQSRQTAIGAYKRSFSGKRIDIITKYRNTMDFLKDALIARAAHLEETQDFFDSVDENAADAGKELRRDRGGLNRELKIENGELRSSAAGPRR